LNVGSIIGRILPGYLADILGPINMVRLSALAVQLAHRTQVIVALALSLIFIAAIWIPSSAEGALIVCALLYGFSSGSWVSICPACVPRIAGGIQNLGVRDYPQ
jgi:predicted anti-sigma-YlaC factor YlaD